jgi:hypothetical protein
MNFPWHLTVIDTVLCVSILGPGLDGLLPNHLLPAPYSNRGWKAAPTEKDAKKPSVGVAFSRDPTFRLKIHIWARASWHEVFVGKIVKVLPIKVANSHLEIKLSVKEQSTIGHLNFTQKIVLVFRGI